jgi:hypothetical protein
MNNHLIRGYCYRLVGIWIWALGFYLISTVAFAHSHIDVQATATGQLNLVGATSETMLYVPPGEPFTLYAPQFPGGYYATELTFSSEDPLTPNALPRIQLLSVSGPEGGSLAFWETGMTTPTWARATGWVASGGDFPGFITYEDETGVGHIHGRLFTATHPGDYTVVFRAVDDSGTRTPSEPKTVVFTVLETPRLTIQMQSGTIRLGFTSRPDLSYDLQVSTTLAANDWTTIQFASGTGTEIQFTDPLADRPRVFYRLVEYR